MKKESRRQDGWHMRGKYAEGRCCWLLPRVSGKKKSKEEIRQCKMKHVHSVTRQIVQREIREVIEDEKQMAPPHERQITCK